jgi:putative methyltransferase (TIGR04325 family)
MSGRLSRSARSIARNLLPPIVTKVVGLAARIGRRSDPPDWQYLPGGWPDEQSLGGWSNDTVVSTQLARWPEFLESAQAPRPFGLSHEAAGGDLDYAVHNTVMSFAYVLARAAHDRGRLSMLDWGGGIGHYYVYAHALMAELELDYCCYDLPTLVAGGRTVLPQVTFQDSEEAALSRRYDLVVASSSLQYARDWRTKLTRLAGVCDDYLYVTRQPFVQRVPSFVVVQRPYRHGYQTEYPGWFLNEAEFLGFASEIGLTLVREFLIEERPFVPGAPEQADYRGFLFVAPRTTASPPKRSSEPIDLRRRR